MYTVVSDLFVMSLLIEKFSSNLAGSSFGVSSENSFFLLQFLVPLFSLYLLSVDELSTDMVLTIRFMLISYKPPASLLVSFQPDPEMPPPVYLAIHLNSTGLKLSPELSFKPFSTSHSLSLLMPHFPCF